MTASSTRATATVGVYGGGRMGAGIAHAFLAAGAAVTVVETRRGRGRRGPGAGRDQPARRRGARQARGHAAEVLARLDVTTDPAALAPAGLVVEAVPEDAALKARVLGAIEEAAPDAVLGHQHQLAVHRRARRRAARDPNASSGCTSSTRCRPATWSRSWSARRTADGARRRPRRRWVGGARQDRDHRHRLAGLRQQPARRRDRPGGDADARGGRRVGRGHRHRDDARLPAPGRPAADHRHRRASTYAWPSRSTSPARSAPGSTPPQILRDKVAAGELGRKTGRGFYDW